MRPNKKRNRMVTNELQGLGFQDYVPHMAKLPSDLQTFDDFCRYVT